MKHSRSPGWSVQDGQALTAVMTVLPMFRPMALVIPQGNRHRLPAIKAKGAPDVSLLMGSQQLQVRLHLFGSRPHLQG
jgi:hypothetical protein